MGIIDKERVLHGLSSCGTDLGIPNICEVTECPYREDKAGCVHELAHDAEMLIAELLKAQEPQEVIRSHDHVEGIILRCPRCKNEIHKYNGKYCPNCGQAVKWE